MLILTERRKAVKLKADALMVDAVYRDGTLNLAGDCSSPVTVYLSGRPDPVLELEHSPVNAYADVRCRKCPECMQHRRRLWAARAADEIRMSYRTWMATLTFTPWQHTVLGARASKRYASAALEPIEAATPEQALRYRLREYTPEVQKYLKRVRASSGARLRYLAVAESHKSGLPHWHLLIHECSNVPVPWSTLSAKWSLGFSRFKLVDQADAGRAAFYCAKYLTKSDEAKIMASTRYGSPRIGADVEKR